MRYWIKLYTEILSDPKMGRLTDRQFRTCINLFALAGEIDNDGFLPTIPDISWRLRTSDDQLTEDMQALARVGIIEQVDDLWHVRKWGERQAKAPSAAPDKVLQRVHEHRERQRNEPDTTPTQSVTTLQPRYSEDVTTLKRTVTPPEKNRVDIEQNREDHHEASDDPAMQAIRNAYDACGLMMSKSHLDAHLETIKRTGLPAWQLGFAAALKAGKHNIVNYVARCAESEMTAQQRGNGNAARTHQNTLATIKADDPRDYNANNTPEKLAAAQIEWDRARAEREAKRALSALPGDRVAGA